MKKFIFKIILFSIPLVILVIYYLLFIHPHIQALAADNNCILSSIGFIRFDKNYTQNIIISFPEEREWFVVDYDETNYNSSNRNFILTIGDSFSDKRNGSYSNHLAHVYNNCTIANKNNPARYDNPFDMFWRLFVNESELPRVIIVESVERHLINRLLDLDFSEKKEMLPYCTEKKEKNEVQRLAKRTRDYYKNLMTVEKRRTVRHVQLEKEMFSCKNSESDFYFLGEEIQTNTPENIQIAAQKLDSLFMFAEIRGINLFILIAADPYDVYQSLIIDNFYPSEKTLEDLSIMVSHPNFINTKHLLMPFVKEGVKDIYWCTDPHWSPVGAKIVAEEIAKRMDSLGVFQN